MRINFRAELDFFYAGRMLMLPGFLFPLRLLVTVLAKIHEAADRRRGVGCNFNEIDAICASQVEGLPQGQNSQLFAINTDDAEIASTDFPVNPDVRTGRRRITRREWAAQDTPIG
jgi:hypothetical protein